MTAYVTCNETISSPAPDERALALGIKPNMRCGLHVPIAKVAAVMQVRCPVGHQFFATPDDLAEDQLRYTSVISEYPPPPDWAGHADEAHGLFTFDGTARELERVLDAGATRVSVTVRHETPTLFDL